MKKIHKFFANLQFIFKPQYWVMLGKYDKAWDQKLLKLVEQHDFEPLTVIDGLVYDAKIAQEYVWVANFPFSFFVPLTLESTSLGINGKILHFFKMRDSDTQSRPSRLTIKRLKKKFDADMAKHDLSKLDLSLKKR